MTATNNSGSNVAIYIAMITVVGSIIAAAIANADKLTAISFGSVKADTAKVLAPVKADTITINPIGGKTDINTPKIALLEKAGDILRERSDQGEEVVCLYSDIITGIGEDNEKRFIRCLVKNDTPSYIYKITVLTDARIKFFNLNIRRDIADTDTLENLGDFPNNNPHRLDVNYKPDKTEDVYFYITARDFRPDISGGNFCIIISHQN